MINATKILLETHPECWIDSTSQDITGIFTRGFQCWPYYWQQVGISCLNAFLAVTFSWSLAVLLPLCLLCTFTSILCMEGVALSELVPHVLHDNSQRLLLYKVTATITMLVLLYDTISASLIDISSVISVTQIISLSFSLAVRPLITNVIDGLFLVIGNTLKKGTMLQMNGIRPSVITKLNLTTVDLQPTGCKTEKISVPYALLASNIITYYSTADKANQSQPSKKLEDNIKTQENTDIFDVVGAVQEVQEE